MNKKILESTKEEIKQEYIKNVAIVKHKIKSNKTTILDAFSGELINCNGYTIENAINENLGLSFRLCKSSDMRAYRLYKRIRDMIETQKAIFVTLTFTDDVLKNNNEDSLRTYTRKYLAAHCLLYVANIDFGSKNHRLHYHALCVPYDNEILDLKSWCYGAINVKRVHNANDTVKVGKYINKLTNHALKDNGFYTRLIYSRPQRTF